MAAFRFLIFLYSLILSCIFTEVQAGSVYGESIVVDYDYSGYPVKISMLVMFEVSLISSNSIKIQFPMTLGPYSQVSGNLYQQDNSLNLSSGIVSDILSKNSYYIFSFGVEIQAEVTYRIEILFANKIVTGIAFVDPIQIFTMSTPGAGAIIYDSNPSLFQLFIQNALSSETLVVSIQMENRPQEKDQTDPGVVYSAFIDITPQISSLEGGYFYVKIGVGANTIGSPTGDDFQFVGNCYSVENICDSRQSNPSCQTINQVKSSCSINQTSKIIEFIQTDPITAGKSIRLRVLIQSPLYRSHRDIEVFSASLRTKRPIEKGRKQLALRVSSVQITLTKTSFLWGIDNNEAISTPFRLFKSVATPFAGPVNSVQQFFTISKIVPEGSQITLKMSTGATGALEHSIITNLPIQSGQSKISCYFNAGDIYCKNIGAFLDINIQYFIAMKIYYNSAATNPTNFGGITLISTVLDSTGATIPGVYLFDQVYGQVITLQQNTEFLDNSATTGWHGSASTWGFGSTQIVSAIDDGTLTGTPNGILSYTSGNTSTVGIVPNMEDDQQLLFFLKTTTAQIGSADNLYYRMKIHYNPTVVKFQDGYSNKGIDFGAYDATNIKWSLDTFQCYSQATRQCVWYNRSGPQANSITFTENSLISNPYAFITFDCGLRTGGVTRATCLNFGGYDSTMASGTNGVIAMRKVLFDSGFQSSLYPDEKLLDFIITFSEQSYNAIGDTYSVVSTQLINAYTILNHKMSNIKASYVNFYSTNSGTLKSNPGTVLPTMLRIGGSILVSEGNGINKIHVFLDQNMDSSPFYSNVSDLSDHTVGCSEGATCQFYGNLQSVVAQDSWFNQRKMEISNLPDIQNEFNILIPIKNTDSTLPTRIVIVLTDSSHSAFGLGGLDYVQNVFRVYGPPVNSLLQTSLTTINSMTQNTAASLTFSTAWAESGNTFQYKFDLTTLGVQDTITSSVLDGSTSTISFATVADSSLYGAGITVTSFTQDIFSGNSNAFKTTPTVGSKTCYSFSYKINDSGQPIRDKQNNYVLFCPIDDSTYQIGTSISGADKTLSNIIFGTPNFPGFFVKDFVLSPVFSYAFSNDLGKIIAFSKETQTVTPSALIGLPYQSTDVSLTSVLYPSSTGSQRVKFVIPLVGKNLQLDSTGLYGFPTIKIIVTFSSFPFTITTGSPCYIDNLVCALTVSSNLEFLLSSTSKYTIENQSSLIITTFPIVAASSSFTYVVKIYIPTLDSSSNPVIFGTNYGTVAYQESASVTFTLQAASYGTLLQLNNLAFEHLSYNARGAFSFDFQCISQRLEFYYTSTFQFTLGYLSSTQNLNLLSTNDMQCQVLQRDSTVANKRFSISHFWKTIIFTSFTSVTITPQAYFNNPHQYQFKFKCVGGSTPDNTNQASSIVGKWMDGTAVVQQTVALDTVNNPNEKWPTILLNLFELQTPVSFTVSPLIVQRYYASPGIDAHYKIEITIETPLSIYSRIFIEFGIGFAPRVNNAKRPECYLTRSPFFDQSGANSIPTFCELTNTRRIRLYVNDYVNSVFYIDILGVSMPPQLPSFSTSLPIHWIGFEDDGNLWNGIAEHGQFQDTYPSSNSYSVMTLLNVTVNSNIIRRAHKLNITLQTQRSNIIASNIFFVDFPVEYDSNKRGQISSCYFSRTFISTYPTTSPSFIASPNLILGCDFISLSRLRVILAKDDDQTEPANVETYSIIISNIISPSQEASKLRFKVFACHSSDLTYAFVVSSDNFADPLHYQAEREKKDVYWSSVQKQQSQYFLLNASDYLLSNYTTLNYAIAYIGYYNCDIQLLPLNHDRFNVSFHYTFPTTNSDSFYFGDVSTTEFIAQTGQSMSSFRLAAKQQTLPGIYKFTPSKSSGDFNLIYMEIPQTTIVVSSDRCKVNVLYDIVYELPTDGRTLPLIFDYSNCLPTNDITLTPYNDLSRQSFLQVNKDVLQTTLNGVQADLSQNKRIYMTISLLAPDSLAVNTIANVGFTLGGTNSQSYFEPNLLKIKVVAPTAFNTQPNASVVTIISQTINGLTVQLQCDQPSVILYALGLSSGMTSMSYQTIQLVLGSKRDNFQDQNDFKNFLIYGRSVVQVAAGTQQVNFQQIQSSSTYLLRYYCINQRQLVSDPKDLSITTLSNGGYLLKVILYFSGIITYSQTLDLTCSLSQIFSVQYSRLLNELNTSCGGTFPSLVTSLTAQFTKEMSADSTYSYSFYVLEDKALTSDTVNTSIKDIIQRSTFSQDLLYLAGSPSGFPILSSFQTEDIISPQAPAIFASVSNTQQTQITLNTFLSNTKGYIYIGIMPGPQTRTFASHIELLAFGQFSDFWRNNVPQEIIQPVVFDNLTEGATYTAFYVGTSDNPSIFALSTQVKSLQFTTSKVQILVKTSANKIVVSFILFFFFIL